MSFRRKPESRCVQTFWTPAFAGVTNIRTSLRLASLHEQRSFIRECEERISGIRGKVAGDGDLANAPTTFKFAAAKWREFADKKFTLQVAVEDCTGCRLCVEICPAKDKSAVGRRAINMAPQPPIREREKKHWEYFLSLPEVNRGELGGAELKFTKTKDVQLLSPLFEFSSACAGCGETPWQKYFPIHLSR